METQSRIIASRISWTEEPGRLHSKGSQRVGHDLVTEQHELPDKKSQGSLYFTLPYCSSCGFNPWIRKICRRKWQPTPVFLTSLVAQTLKRLSTMWETQVRSLGWEVPWRRKWQSTPVLLPGKSHGQRVLAGDNL